MHDLDLMLMMFFAFVCLLVRLYPAMWALVIEVGAHPGEINTRWLLPRRHFFYLIFSFSLSQKNIETSPRSCRNITDDWEYLDITEKYYFLCEISWEILRVGGEILWRILIVTSLGWKEVYGVEAVKTLWPLSGNTFSRTTGPTACIRF